MLNNLCASVPGLIWFSLRLLCTSSLQGESPSAATARCGPRIEGVQRGREEERVQAARAAADSGAHAGRVDARKRARDGGAEGAAEEGRGGVRQGD